MFGTTNVPVGSLDIFCSLFHYINDSLKWLLGYTSLHGSTVCFSKAIEKHKVEKTVWFMWFHSDLKLLGATNCT